MLFSSFLLSWLQDFGDWFDNCQFVPLRWGAMNTKIAIQSDAVMHTKPRPLLFGRKEAWHRVNVNMYERLWPCNASTVFCQHVKCSRDVVLALSPVSWQTCSEFHLYLYHIFEVLNWFGLEVESEEWIEWSEWTEWTVKSRVLLEFADIYTSQDTMTLNL